MASKPGNIDEYLCRLSEDKRAALQGLRETIHAAAPDAEECISYQMPSFRLKTGMLVSFAAWKEHCALYPLSIATVRDLEADLRGFDAEKGTIRFAPDRPLPASLVTKLVEARVAENARRRAAKAKR
jgi:uncharacterized protein YdhG (YjbR/CyaY superfamily)